MDDEEDLLEPVDERAGPFSIIACSVMGVIFSLMAFCTLFMEHEEGRLHPGLSMLLFAFLAFLSFSIAVKLYSGKVSRNGITIIPIWLLQAFGVFIVIISVYGLIDSLFLDGEVNRTRARAVSGIAFGIVLLFIGRRIRKKREEINSELDERLNKSIDTKD